MKILAFAASNSQKSINKQLILYATKIISTNDIEILDINDYEIPIYSPEREQQFLKNGNPPEKAQQFYNKISNADALIISFAEHNGSYTAAYKNLFDWASRINPKVYQNKDTIMLATSPGAKGASSVLQSAVDSAPYFAANVKASLSIPNFYQVFDSETNKLTDNELNSQLISVLNKLQD
jgi:NAD(P)H-dependent FMN reductase